MLRNYLKVALRNFFKQKSYSAINIAGLAVGMACCIFILAFVLHETSYDSFHAYSDRIVRLAANADMSGRVISVATTPAPMGPQLVEDFPEVVAAARLSQQGDHLLGSGERQFREKHVLYADSDLFDVLSFRMVRGDASSALDVACSIVITPEAAKRYFGDTDPLGKVLKNVEGGEDLTVTGIVEAPSARSHIRFDALISIETLRKRSSYGMQWHNFNYYTYLLLAPGTDADVFEAKLAGFNEKYLGDFMKAIGGTIETFVQPLTSIHLGSHLESELSVNGDSRYVYAFAAIGAFILILACINFMNLSTARSANRAREVGLRKVLGAEKRGLVAQFLIESFLMAALSMVLAMLLVATFNPYFQRLAGREVDVSFAGDPLMTGGLFFLVAFVGLAAGSYPALYLSGFRPAVILKGKLSRGGGSSNFRRALVVFQFAISIALIIGTGVITRQLQYMRSVDLGFEKERVLVLPIRDAGLVRQSGALKEELLSLQSVRSATIAMMVPGEANFNISMYIPEGRKSGETVMFQNIAVDHDYLATLGIDIVAGRDFSRDHATDLDNAVILNESAAREIGWSDPLGKRIYYSEGTEYFEGGDYYTVVGVMSDVHHRSLHYAVEPLMLRYTYNAMKRMALRVETSDLPGTLAAIGEVWGDFSGGRPFEYFFLDEYFDGLYRSEEKLGGIFRVFTAFAVFIGCLGLFGLVSFAAEQRTREIGIRKVLGSSEGAIVILLCREFFLLVLAANAVAWPVSYLAMSRWLENFPYRTGISPATFLMAGSSALLIALLTVGYRAVRAACSNPIDALRYE